MADGGRLKVLFLCTGNSARSVLAEHLLREADPRRFATWSAGSHPKGEVHPLTLRVLREVYGIDAGAARSKSMEEVRGIDFDFVITACDNARESCPYWPGKALLAHWGLPDPAAVDGSPEEQLQAFQEAARLLRHRIGLLAALPLYQLDRPRLAEHLREIGAITPP